LGALPFPKRSVPKVGSKERSQRTGAPRSKTNGDLVSYSLLPDGSRNESSQFRQTFYDVRKTPWFSLASPGPSKWAPLRFASIKNDLGQLPYIAIQTHMINVTTASGEVPLVLASTLYVTPDKYRAQFSNLTYDFTSYVVDGVSLNESQLILASAGTVRGGWYPPSHTHSDLLAFPLWINHKPLPCRSCQLWWVFTRTGQQLQRGWCSATAG
jgi:hypothetical protein